MGAVNTPSSLVPATPAPTHDRPVLVYRSDPLQSAALSALLPAAATRGRLLLVRGAARRGVGSAAATALGLTAASAAATLMRATNNSQLRDQIHRAMLAW